MCKNLENSVSIYNLDVWGLQDSRPEKSDISQSPDWNQTTLVIFSRPNLVSWMTEIIKGKGYGLESNLSVKNLHSYSNNKILGPLCAICT